MLIGVLALQGAFQKHIEAITSLGSVAREIRRPKDLQECDGLIIPGGESTVISKQLRFSGLLEAIIHFAREKPIFGTCAGLIVMSTTEFPKHLGITNLNLLDIEVERNAYGRQTESFCEEVSCFNQKFPAFFIRAPQIKNINSSQIEVLATYRGQPIFVKQGRHLGASFHPELTSNLLIHSYFLDSIQQVKKNNHYSNSL